MDARLVAWQESGDCVLCGAEKYLTEAEKAFLNITARMTGTAVPLLDGVYNKKIKRKSIKL